MGPIDFLLVNLIVGGVIKLKKNCGLRVQLFTLNSVRLPDIFLDLNIFLEIYVEAAHK